MEASDPPSASEEPFDSSECLKKNMQELVSAVFLKKMAEQQNRPVVQKKMSDEEIIRAISLQTNLQSRGITPKSSMMSEGELKGKTEVELTQAFDEIQKNIQLAVEEICNFAKLKWDTLKNEDLLADDFLKEFLDSIRSMSTRQKNPQKTFKEDFQLTDRLMETIESIGMAMIEQGLFSSAFATFSLLMRLDPIKPSYVLWAAHSAYQEAQYLKASELYTLYMLLDFEEKTFLPYLIDAQIRCQREEAAKQIFEHMKEFLSEDEIDIQKQCEALLLRISSKPK